METDAGTDGGSVADAGGGLDAGAPIDAGAPPDGGDMSWRTEPALPEPVQEIAVAVLDDRIYVAGGFAGGAVVPTVSIFDAAASTWSRRAPAGDGLPR